MRHGIQMLFDGSVRKIFDNSPEKLAIRGQSSKNKNSHKKIY